jgi:hypothetical protein
MRIETIYTKTHIQLKVIILDGALSFNFHVLKYYTELIVYQSESHTPKFFILEIRKLWIDG